MSLRIVKASEPITIEQLVVCIYGPPGLGKSTLCFTADDPICFDFDKGSYRASNRKDTVQIGSWSEVANITASDLEGYKTVIVDTAGRALDALAVELIAQNPKMGRAGTLSLQGFGALKAGFAGWLKMVKSFGKDVVLVAHMDEQRNGDEVIERLDIQGSSKGEIYKSADAMGRLLIQDKKRRIDFSPRENAFGKNPAGLEVLDVPDISKDGHFLGQLIHDIKAKINAMSEEQKEAQRILEEWSEVINQLEDVDDFNRNAGIKQAPKAAQELFKARAKSLGFVVDRERKIYVKPEAVSA